MDVKTEFESYYNNSDGLLDNLSCGETEAFYELYGLLLSCRMSNKKIEAFWTLFRSLQFDAFKAGFSKGVSCGN